jgi:hypothetical protein
MASEILQITPESFLSQDYKIQDTSLLSPFNVDTSLSSSGYIESFIYDNNKNVLNSNYNFSQYTVLNNGQSAGLENDIASIEMDPESVLTDSGYNQGIYNLYFNFFNKQVGSNLQQLYISEISSDRTEIRLDSTALTIVDIIEQVSKLIQQRESSPYFLDFYLNFGENQLAIANNIQLDNQDPTNPTILIKLYEALPAQFNLNSTLWIVTTFDQPIAYQVTFEPIPIVITDTVPVKGPNFNLDLKDQVNNSTVSLDYTSLTTTTLTSSFNQLSSLLEEKEIDINIDYTDFNNFTHFSSVQARLENFYYKVSLLEDYSASIATLNNTTNNNPISSLAIYEAKINDIITNFDGYEYYLYYTSGSYAWPKSTSQPPYQLFTIGSPEVLTWFGSNDDTNPYYGGIILSASLFDNTNQNNLYYSIPEYLRNDPQNQPYELFVEMVGQFYDNIWIYYKDVTEKYNADNRLENGVSKDIVADAIRDFGIKLYQNNFSNDDLYTAFLGLTPGGNLFPFPNITGSLPTPSGFEYIDTFISASNDYTPLDDVNKSLYKRIYHNIPYLLKAKGTLPALRTLITSYGIPDTVLRINEYGGKDKSNTNDWDYWEDTFNYAFYTTGSNFMSTTWAPLNSSWDTPDNCPDSVLLRFKTEGLPFNSASVAYQSLWHKDGSTSHLVLRYEGTGYNTNFPTPNNPLGSPYSGSVIDPYYQYAYLDFYPSYINEPNISASVYLPFFDGGWWSVAVNRDGTNFTLSSGNKIYEGGENGTELGFYSTSSVVADDVEWVNYGTSYFARGGVTIDGNLYEYFSGSLQEIRYYTTALSESVFKDYIMNPHSIEGNSLNSSPNEVIFRSSLGGELYTGSVSIHPKVTGSWITTSSFDSNSDFYFGTTPTFVPNTEYFFYDQVAAGIKNAVSDKIRLENNAMPSGDVLSPFRSLAQNVAASQSYTANTNLLEVAFSPQDEINQDIMDQIGYFNIGEFIGDPRQRSSSATSYPDLDTLRNAYFEKYTKNYDLNDFIRLIKFFDNSLFKMIKDFVPARTSLASGVVIKQHLLERNKYPQPQTDINSTIAYYTSGSNSPLGSGSVNNVPFIFQNIIVSGTVAPQWNNYNPGTIENFSGGTGGSFEIFNGLSTSPSGTLGTGPNNIFFITQSWIETIQTTSGSVSILHDAQDEFYDGEFSGSYIEIDDGELNPSNPYKSAPIQYISFTTSGSTNPTPSPGFINWTTAIGYNGSNYSLYVNTLYINEIDANGINIQTALQNLGAGDTINFTITGSTSPGNQPYTNNTLTGIITSIAPTSATTWAISLGTNLGSQATFVTPFNLTGSNNPSVYSNSPIYLNPYLNDSSNFYYSDFNPIMNNIEDARLSDRFEEVEYYPGITTPINLGVIISGSAIKAAVQDSNYSSKRVINPRYNGVKSTSQLLNTWSPPNTILGYSDQGTYGKIPTVESLKTMVAYCDWIGGWPPDRENASAVHVLYLIKSDGSVIIPNTSQNSLFDIKGTFESGERILISPKTIAAGQPQQYRNVIRGGTRIEPILYTQYGQAPNTTWNTTMSFEDFLPSTTGAVQNYTALYGKTGAVQTLTYGTPQQVTINQTIYGTPVTSNSYTIPLNAVQDGVQLNIDANIRIRLLNPNSSGNSYSYQVTLYIYKNSTVISDFPYNAVNIYPNNEEYIEFSNTSPITLSPGDYTAGDTISAYIKVDNFEEYPGGAQIFNANTFLKISQYPAYTQPVTASGANSIWNWPDSSSYPYVITSSQTTLVNLFGDPNVKMVDIVGSGFNPIVLPWSIEYGDEFRFEGREDFVYQVGKIFAPEDSGSGRLFQTGSIEVHFNTNLPISASTSVFNLDHFLIRRYIDDASQILMEGFKPVNSQGPFIVRPEYIVPELDKSVDEFILDLTQKGLIP